MIYRKLTGSDWRLVSTAYSSHPSFRKLSLAIPKHTRGMGWSPFIVYAIAGVVVGAIMFEVPALYNYFIPWIAQIDEFFITQAF